MAQRQKIEDPASHETWNRGTIIFMVGSAYPSPPTVTSQVTPMVMTLSKFTEVLRLNEADSKAYESIDWNEQRVAATDRELRGVCWL